MAITISVGFVVDDAIVVIENIYRLIEHGESAMAAALKGARQIGFTIISMSTSLVAVFIPLLFMGGLIGRLFHEFAVTLSLAILVSGVLSLTLTPMLCSRFLRAESSYGAPGGFYRAAERSFNWLLGGYKAALRWVLRHQAFMLLFVFATLVATVLALPDRAQGLLPAAGHRQHDGHDRSRPGHLLSRDDRTPARSARDRPGRSGGRVDRLLPQRQWQLHRQQWPHVHHAQAGRAAGRHRRPGHRPAAAARWRN